MKHPNPFPIRGQRPPSLLPTIYDDEDDACSCDACGPLTSKTRDLRIPVIKPADVYGVSSCSMLVDAKPLDMNGEKYFNECFKYLGGASERLELRALHAQLADEFKQSGGCIRCLGYGTTFIHGPDDDLVEVPCECQLKAGVALTPPATICSICRGEGRRYRAEHGRVIGVPCDCQRPK